MKDLSHVQLAYLAGLIDGEGYLCCQREMQRHGRTPRFSLRLAFVFATEEPLRTVAGWLGLQPKRFASRDVRRANHWRLHIPKGLAYQLVLHCLPYLILKQRQAQLFLQIEDTRAAASPPKRHFGHGRFRVVPQEAVARMEVLYRELRSLMSKKGRKPTAA